VEDPTRPPILLRPVGRAWPRRWALAVIPLLILSGTLVVVAAWSMPEDYSWRRLSISESAAQGQQHAWVARLAFLCFGAGVLLLALAMRDRWPRITYACHLVFAAAMAGAAAFSHSPWQAGVPADPVEDFLHSICATGMGFAFCIGVTARLVQRGRETGRRWMLDATALFAAAALPLVLASAPEVGGLMQRTMFAISYVWFGREAVLAVRREGRPATD